MNAETATKAAAAALTKANPTRPAIAVTGALTLVVLAGTSFAGTVFNDDTDVATSTLTPGTDYLVAIDDTGRPFLTPAASRDACFAPDVIGGIHFAPGGNATGRAGGDDVAAFNPCSAWDQLFRPDCPDPRGMALVEAPHGRFWMDVYLLAKDHLANGTSQHGVTIADGEDPPENPAGGRFKKLDYETAQKVLAHHGKGLPSLFDFFEAAFGVTEKTARGNDPKITGLDAPRTSRFGIQQASGNLWVWGHDGDPDLPRAALFGGSWWTGGLAGSRQASVGDWPGLSSGVIGARGRCDHLQLG